MPDPQVVARLEEALQAAINGMEPDCTLSDWVITASGVKLAELGERTHMFYLPRPKQALHITRGLAVSGADLWRSADESDDDA